MTTAYCDVCERDLTQYNDPEGFFRALCERATLHYASASKLGMPQMPRLTLHLKSTGRPYHAGDYEMHPDQYERLLTDWRAYQATGEPKSGEYEAFKIEFHSPFGERHPLLIEFAELALIG